MWIPNEHKDIGYCSNHRHNHDINESTYRFKGCWGCPWFSENDIFPWIDVGTLAVKLGCSKSKIYRLIHNYTLDAEMISQERGTGMRGVLPAPAKWHITKESAEEYIKVQRSE